MIEICFMLVSVAAWRWFCSSLLVNRESELVYAGDSMTWREVKGNWRSEVVLVWVELEIHCGRFISGVESPPWGGSPKAETNSPIIIIIHWVIQILLVGIGPTLVAAANWFTKTDLIPVLFPWWKNWGWKRRWEGLQHLFIYFGWNRRNWSQHRNTKIEYIRLTKNTLV